MCYLRSGQFTDETERFLIREWVGFGGAAPHFELFTAEDRSSGELVLVKVFPRPEWTGGAFEQEMEKFGSLHHESLISPLGYGKVTADAHPFGSGTLLYAAEPVQPGVTLDRYLDDDPPAEKVEPLFQSIVSGLRYLRESWGLCDVPVREIAVARPDLARWSLVGSARCQGTAIPNVVRTISRRYPGLQGLAAAL